MHKIRNFDLEDYILKLVIMLTFLLIGSKTINIDRTNIYIELSTVAMGLFLMVFFFNISKYKASIKDLMERYKYLFFIAVVYIGLNLIYIVFNFKLNILIYYVAKVIPVIFFLALFTYINKVSKKKVRNIFTMIFYCILAGVIISLIMYIFKFTNGAFSLQKIVHLVSFKESIDLFGEVRLYGLLSHKARFVVYCMMGLVLAYYNKALHKNIKRGSYIIFTIAAILSNSMMGIAIYLAIGFSLIIDRIGIATIKTYYIKRKKIIICISFLAFTLGVLGLIYISTKRDLSTLGHRTYIWKAGINTFWSNISGVGIMPDELWIKAYHNGHKLYFSNAHNNYINEFIESGLLVGISYIAFNINLIKEILKVKKIGLVVMYVFIYCIFLNFESIDIREIKNILLSITPILLVVLTESKECIENEEVNDSSLYI